MADHVTTGMGADPDRIPGADELEAAFGTPVPRRRGWARRSTRRLLHSRERASGEGAPPAEELAGVTDTALEQRLMRALRDVAATLDVAPADLIEGIVRSALEKSSETGDELGTDRGPEPQGG